LFEASLNGEKIFENLYRDRDFPKAVYDVGISQSYRLLCPRIATLLCKIPAAIKEWESQAWSENFKRLDELTENTTLMFNKVDELSNTASKNADVTLNKVRRTLAQKIFMELDLTGLRADKPLAGKFDDFFVHPQISEDQEKEEVQVILVTADDCFNHLIVKKQTALIIGAPGAGKSTWTRWLNRETLSDQWGGFTVRIELRSLNQEDLPSLHTLIRQTVGKHLEEEVDSERIRLWLDKHLVSCPRSSECFLGNATF
jgi:ABC-type multidrug transport system fused ATPase/permease subunit